MPGDNNQNSENNEGNNQNNENNEDKNQNNKEDVSKLVDEQVAAQLKEIKENLNKAYKARDDALAAKAELERKEQEAEIKRLKEEGKHKEAAELLVAEEKAKREAAEKRVVELTRDVTVKGYLTGLNFRNDKAADVAFKEIVGQLTQDEKGDWVHKSGVSIKDFIEKFVSDEDQSFLFKPKVNSGGGSSGGSGNEGSPTPKSVFGMKQADVLAMGAKGPIKLK